MNLMKLTVKDLDSLASELNIILKKSSNKPAKVSSILHAGIPQHQLELVYNKYLKTKKSSKIELSDLVEQLKLHDNQIKYLISKLDNIEIKLAHLGVSSAVGTSKDLKKIKNIIKSKVISGESISVDELVGLPELKEFSTNFIEAAVRDLIDDEILDSSEGKSIIKFEQNIGRLIRR